MPGAVLHVNGRLFDPDRVLPTLSLQPYQVYRRGEPLAAKGSRSNRYFEVGGFKCVVSEADGLLSDQAEDALAFLKKYHVDLAALRDDSDVETLLIDFGYDLRIDGKKTFMQCDSFSAELLRCAGELGVGFDLSLYPTSEPNEL
jgi:hypothetical protein